MLVNKAVFFGCSALSVCAGVYELGEHWPGKNTGIFLRHSRPYLSESGSLSESWAHVFQPGLLPSNHSNPVFTPGKSWGSEYAGNQP